MDGSGGTLPSYFDGGAAAPGAAPSASLPPPPMAPQYAAPTAPPAPAHEQREQEEKILTQEVSQAFYHLADAQKRFHGGAEETSVAGETKAAGTLKARAGGTTAAATKARQQHTYMMRRGPGGDSPSLGGFKLEFTSGYINFIPEMTLLFLSCLLPILAVAGRGVLATLLVGLLATYMFDYTNQKHAALGSVWCCVVAVWMGLYLTNITAFAGGWLNIFVLLNSSMYLLLLGVFATIQFRWLQVQYPEVALASERVLLGLTPMTCLPLLFSTLVSFAGSHLAPFALVALMCALHRTFYTLRKSAFKEALAPDAKWEEYINGRLEAIVFSAATAALPPLLYVASFSADGWFDVLYILNTASLAAAPLLYLCYRPETTLWWAYRQAYTDRTAGELSPFMQTARMMTLGVAYSVVLHLLIYRVAFGRFAYMFTGVRPPWNVLLIALAAYAGSIVLYLAVQLVEAKKDDPYGRAARWSGVLLLSIASAGLFTYVAGMPQFFIGCASLSASCLVNFCLDPRNINNYILFVCTTIVVLVWWMYHSFSFLHMELPILGGTEYISLPQLSVYILWLYLIQCTIFPLGIAGKGDTAFYISLLQQVCALAMVEHVLYSQVENFYPALCVLGTTCWGIYFCSTLHHNKRLSKAQSSVLVGLYVAKLYLFAMVGALPEQDSELFKAAYGQYSLVLAFLFVAIIVSIAVQLHWERQERLRRSSFNTLTSLYLLASVAVALLSKDSVVLALLELTTGDEVVNTGRLIGLVALFAGCLQLPLTAVLPPSQTRPSKICQGFIVVGAIIALLDPVLEGGGAEAEDFDMDVYQQPAWAPYVGMLSVAGVGVSLLGVVTLPDNTALRIMWWTVVAAGTGTSYTAAFIPHPSWHSYLLITLAMGLTVLCVDMTHYSVSSQDESSNSVLGLYAGTLISILASLLDAQWRVPEDFDYNLRIETSTQRQNALLCLCIGINIVMAALIKLKLTDRPALRPRSLKKLDSIRERLGEGSHFGLLANICAIQAYVSLLMLHSDVGSSSPTFPVLISPVLLLMHDDGEFMRNAASADQLARYVPPVLASLGTLSWRIAMADLPMLIGRSPVSFAVQLTVFLLALAIGLSAAYDMWIDAADRRKEGGADNVVIGICVVLVLAAGTEALRLMAGVVLIACILPVFNDSAWAKKVSDAL